MVTLKTLNQATEQEVFDQVTVHLLSQMKKATDEEGTCMYRAGHLCCAAGCLIADDEYDVDFECKSWKSLVLKYKLTNKHIDLITDLQHIHDSTYPEDWEKELKQVAKKYNLTYNGINR